METLEISRVNAVKAYKQADNSGKKLLADLFGEDNLKLDIKDRIKSYQDACDELGIMLLTIDDFEDLPVIDRTSCYAHHQITIITRALNEGWYPDWSDSNQYKYYPWFRFNKLAGAGSGFSCNAYHYANSVSAVGSRLVFHSSDLATYAGQQFIDIYNKFLL